MKRLIAILIIVVCCGADRGRVAPDKAHWTRRSDGVPCIVNCEWVRDITPVAQTYDYILMIGPETNWNVKRVVIEDLIDQLFDGRETVDAALFSRLNTAIGDTNIVVEPFGSGVSAHFKSLFEMRLVVENSPSTTTTSTTSTTIATTTATTTGTRTTTDSTTTAGG